VVSGSLTAADEAARAPAQAGFGDRLTFSFGANDGRACGVAEFELDVGNQGQPRARGHALLFWERRLAASASRPLGAPAGGWEALSVSIAGLETAVLEPLARWSLGFRDERGDGFDLEFAALGAPAVIDPASAFATASGLEGYEQLCRVSGTVTVDRSAEAIEGLGQRGHHWGPHDARGAELVRDVAAWLDPGTAVTLTSIRPRGAGTHEGEVTSAFLIEAEPAASIALAEARLSTTYDRDGHPLRAGLELWPSAEAEFPRRLAGEAICRGALELESEQLEYVFLSWHMEGRSGLGRYELRRMT
jgi:hypothetical protein